MQVPPSPHSHVHCMLLASSKQASSILKEKSLLKAELSQHSLPPRSDNSDLSSREEVTKLREELVLLKASMSKSGDTKELEYTLIETKVHVNWVSRLQLVKLIWICKMLQRDRKLVYML